MVGSPARADGRLELSRRRLMQLAALAVATTSACSKELAVDPTSPASGPIPIVKATPLQTPKMPTAPPVVPASHVVLCRDAWGANRPRAGGTPHTPVRMTIHHTAVALGDNTNSPSRLRQHQHYHQDTHGWIDIAYHLSVDRNGNIYELRKPELVGDTATSYDPTGHFLVVCEGNFDEEKVTEAQLNGAALAFAWAAQRFETQATHSPATATPAPTPCAQEQTSTPTSAPATSGIASTVYWPPEPSTFTRSAALRRQRPSRTSKPVSDSACDSTSARHSAFRKSPRRDRYRFLRK